MKAANFENPLSGERGSVLDLGKWWSLILGTVMILFVMGFAQRLANIFSRRIPVPGGVTPGFSTSPFGSPAAAASGPAYEIYE